jgi:hypothetical protein
VAVGELLGALSAADFAAGIPLETSLRTCVLATRLARRVGIPELDEVRSTTLLRHLGCTAFAHEAARLGGDDHDLLNTYAGVDRGADHFAGSSCARAARQASTNADARAATSLADAPGG